MFRRLLVSVLLAGLTSIGYSECPNGCNGHGKCTSYDMCICNRNWQANDCSERVCQFGLAHVDTPKGDLDMSGTITGPDSTVAENSFTFPYGTSEQFPQGRDSDLREVTNSAHYYMECSNKGTCNRDTGLCECFPGYDGAACQRASCPGWPDVCSGHGVCKTIRQLANADGNNIYELWDRHSTMGCECDDGFDGPDCSERKCKYGIDPLYYDDSSTIKYSTFNFGIFTDNAGGIDFYDGSYEDDENSNGHFALRFFDMFGEDWVTEPLSSGSTCDEVMNALYTLPNNVIPTDSLLCDRIRVGNGGAGSDPLYRAGPWNTATESANGRTMRNYMALWEYSVRSSSTTALVGSALRVAGYIYRIKFAGNPGALKEPEIEIYLDGLRPSLATRGSALVTKVWTDGQQGESVDYVADYCAGVSVTLADGVGYRYLSGLTTTETELLKACLGGSNFDNSDNVEIYDWDHATEDYPHLIKLVLTTAESNDGGYYAAVRYVSNQFRLMNNFVSPDQGANDNFDVYTTRGVLARTSEHTNVAFGFGSNEMMTTATLLYGDLSCEINDNNGVKRTLWIRNNPDSQTTCLNKTNIFTVLSTTTTENPIYINLYTVEKIYQKQFSVEVTGARSFLNYFNSTYTIKTDLSSNFATTGEHFHVYKFFPNTESSYTYVSQCSNRGICNHDTGLCECFGGYTDDACQSQNSLAV